MSARKRLYHFGMLGKAHSPDNSNRMSEEIDAFRAEIAHELAEEIRQEAHSADIPGSPASPDFVRGMLYAADFVDPEVK